MIGSRQNRVALCRLAVVSLLVVAGCRMPETHARFRPPPAPAPVAAAADTLTVDGEPPAEVDAVPPPEAGPWHLSVEQAVVFALRHNRDLAVQRFGPIIAGTFEDVERGEFDPEVFASLTFTKEVVSETDRATGGQFSVEGQDEETAVGIRQKLPSGTAIEVTVDHQRSTSNRTPEQQTAQAGFRVTQALLRGRRLAANVAAIRQAELATEISQHELRGYTEQVVANTEVAYWSFVLAARAIAIFESSLGVAQQQHDEIAQRIEVGTLPRHDAAASRAEVARREQALIDARSLLESRRLQLLRLIDPNRDPKGYALLPDSQPDLAAAPMTNLAERTALALRNRAELAEARLELEQGRLETIVTRDGLLPRLDFFLAFGRSGFDDTLSGAFGNIADLETYELTAGVELSQFLDNRAAKARDRAAQASHRQAEQAIANLEDIVLLDVRLAVNEVERARQQINATAVTRSLQEASLQAEQERLDAGAGTTLQVAQAQRDLLESQIAANEAVVTYRLALTRLYLAEGSLLQRRGIAVQ